MLNYAKDWDQSYTLRSKIMFYLSVKKTYVSITYLIGNKLLDS